MTHSVHGSSLDRPTVLWIELHCMKKEEIEFLVRSGDSRQ